MSDTFGVRGGQRIGELRAISEHQVHRQAALFEMPGQSLALDQLHHQVIGTDVIERTYVRMVERRNGQSLTLEPASEFRMSDLNCHIPAQPRVAGLKNFAHAALPKAADDLVRPYLVPAVHCVSFSRLAASSMTGLSMGPAPESCASSASTSRSSSASFAQTSFRKASRSPGVRSPARWYNSSI